MYILICINIYNYKHMHESCLEREKTNIYFLWCFCGVVHPIMELQIRSSTFHAEPPMTRIPGFSRSNKTALSIKPY